jgi:hypothetical protein
MEPGVRAVIRSPSYTGFVEGDTLRHKNAMASHFITMWINRTIEAEILTFTPITPP